MKKNVNKELKDDSLRQGTLTIIIVSISILVLLIKLFSYINITYLLTGLVTIVLIIVVDLYRLWYTDFHSRYWKSEIGCPSNGDSLPKVHGKPFDVINNEENEEMLKTTTNALFGVNFELNREKPVNRFGSKLINLREKVRKLVKSSLWSSHLHNDGEQLLDMDHMKLTFVQFLWGYLMLLPRLFFCNLEGYFCVIFSMLFYCVWPQPCDYNVLVANLLLESSMCLYYVQTLSDQSKSSAVAKFVISSAALIFNDGKLSMKDDIIIFIDLIDRKYVEGSLGGKVLSAQDAAVVIGFVWMSSHHVKSHSYANWGSNSDTKSIGKKCSIIEELSIVTTLYNHFGYKGFPIFCNLASSLGLVCKVEMAETLQSGIDRGVNYHAHIIELYSYSKYVKFITKVRGHFLHEFVKYKQTDFPTIHGEALFAGTVLHSTDHSQFRRYFYSNLWCRPLSKEYDTMGRLFFFVLVGFTNDLPLMINGYRFKNINHPFFHDIYKFSYDIDNFLASHMDGCICK